jgi:hypothetical protein
MSPWKWWGRRRLAVWDRRLKRRRAIWESIPYSEVGKLSDQESWLYWESQVTKALAKRVKWRKRAGVRKLSPPPGKPEPRLPDPFRPPERKQP